MGWQKGARMKGLPEVKPCSPASPSHLFETPELSLCGFSRGKMGSWCPLCVFVATGNPGAVTGALFTSPELG